MRKSIISHVVTLVLGLIGGFLGKDLTGLQAPVEAAVNVAADAVVPPPPAPAEAPAPAPADAGTPAPAPADAGQPAK